MALEVEGTYIIFGAVLAFLGIIIIVIVLVACRGRCSNLRCTNPGCLIQPCICPWMRRVNRSNMVIRRRSPGRISMQNNIRLRVGVTQADSKVLVNSTGSENSVPAAADVQRQFVVVTGPEHQNVPQPTPVRPANTCTGPYVARVPLDNNGGMHQSCGFPVDRWQHDIGHQVTRPYNVDRHVSQVQCVDIHGHVGPAANVQISAPGPPPEEPRLYPTLGSMMRQEGMNEIHIHAPVPEVSVQGSSSSVYPSLGSSEPVLAVPPAYTTLPR